MLLFFLPHTSCSSIHSSFLSLTLFLAGIHFQLSSTLAAVQKKKNSTRASMKLSLKFRGNDDVGDQSSTQTQIMTAKIPIIVFNNPFISGITSTNTNNNSSSDFTFSLSTNFPTGPTLKLSYSPSSSSSPLPFSLSLKSGLSIFGSPRNSPLIFSANFPLSLSTTTHNTPLPSFFLHFKPQFGHFSLNKTVFSDSNNNSNIPLSPQIDNPQYEKGFVASPDESSSGWQNLKLEPFDNREHNKKVVVLERKNNENCGLSPGVAVMTRTVVPVTQGLLLNFRWGVNFVGKSGFKMPYLTVNKIGLERVEEVKQSELQQQQNNTDDDEKGMFLGTKRELESVEKENREMKRVLDEMRKSVSNSTTCEGRRRSDGSNGNKQKSFGSNINNNGNGRQENDKKVIKEPNQNKPQQSDFESELEKAIKAASSS